MVRRVTSVIGGANEEDQQEPGSTQDSESEAYEEGRRWLARAEGLRLFKVAGRPKREDFLAVFGKNGDRLT